MEINGYDRVCYFSSRGTLTICVLRANMSKNPGTRCRIRMLKFARRLDQGLCFTVVYELLAGTGFPFESFGIPIEHTEQYTLLRWDFVLLTVIFARPMRHQFASLFLLGIVISSIGQNFTYCCKRGIHQKWSKLKMQFRIHFCALIRCSAYEKHDLLVSVISV